MQMISFSCIAVMCVTPAPTMDDDEDAKSEVAIMKKLLDSTAKLIKPRIADDEKAVEELEELTKAKSEDLRRMIKDVKKSFKIKQLDAEALKEIDPILKKAIRSATPKDIKAALRKRDPNALPESIRPKMCWLWGCP